MRLIKFGSFLLILLVAFTTAESVEKPDDVASDVSESSTDIPEVTTDNVVESTTNSTREGRAAIDEEIKEVKGEDGEVVTLGREALLEKRSIGNIARLLLGGNVPPNHPLVKTADPKTFSLASNIVASVPGREYGGSGLGWNSGWNNNALAQLSALLSTKQRLLPHLSQVTSGVTGLAGVKGELFHQIQKISTAAIAQAAADAAAKAVAASAAAQAVTNTVAQAVHQTPHAVEEALKYTNNNLLHGWSSNQQNQYVAPSTHQNSYGPPPTQNNYGAAPTQAAYASPAVTQNSLVNPFTQQSQINSQFRSASAQQPNYHPSYSQYQQQQQQYHQQPQPTNNLYNQQSYNNGPPGNSYNNPGSHNLNNLPTPLVAAPSNQNQAPASADGSRNALPSNNNYNTQAHPAAFNSAGNSFGSPPFSNNAQQYSSAPSGNSYNNQQFPPAQNYGGYNNAPYNNNNNNYNGNAPVGGAGPSNGYASGQHSQPTGSHAYPPNGPGSYSGPPSGNFNSASGVSGYPNTGYHPSAQASGNQYSQPGNGPQNFRNPGPPYNSPPPNAYQSSPPPFNAPQNSYNGGPNSNFNHQGPANGFSGYGNSRVNQQYNFEGAPSNLNQNYNPNNNYNRYDNQFNNNQNNYNRNSYDNNNNNNNNNNFNRNNYDGNTNAFQSPNNGNQGGHHSRFENRPPPFSRKGGDNPAGRYGNRHDDDSDEDSLERRQSPTQKQGGKERQNSSSYRSDREDRDDRVKPIYKESYNPNKHRWTEHSYRGGQVDDRSNIAPNPKSKFGASRRAYNGHRSRPREQPPREIYTTLPEYVFRNDRPHRSANTSALLTPVVDPDVDTSPLSINVSPVEHDSGVVPLLSPSSGTTGSSSSVSSSIPATLTVDLPSAEQGEKISHIFPAISVFETSYVS